MVYDLLNINDKLFNFDMLLNYNSIDRGFKSSIYEVQDGLLIEVEMPGVDVDSVMFAVYDNKLSISGIKKSQIDSLKDVKILHKECDYGTVKRDFYLNLKSYDTDLIKAKMLNGMLIINIPKKSKEQCSDYKLVNVEKG